MTEEELPVSRRKFEELRFELVNSGALLEIARWHRNIFDAYLEAGFNPAQAVELTKARIASELNR